MDRKSGSLKLGDGHRSHDRWSDSNARRWEASILAWTILGLIAGALASTMMRGGGYAVGGDIIVGVVRAITGGFGGSMLFGADVTRVNASSLIVSAAGAVALIAMYRALSGSRCTV